MAVYYKDGVRLPYKDWPEEAKKKHKEANSKRAKANPEKAAEYRVTSYNRNKESKREYARLKKQQKRKENPLRENLLAIKSRSKRKGIEFSITEDDVKVPELCPVLGFPIQFNTGSFVGRRNSVSIDRIDPNLGYTPDNIMVMSYLANSMKQDATPEELRMFAKWVLKTFPEEQDGKR